MFNALFFFFPVRVLIASFLVGGVDEVEDTVADRVVAGNELQKRRLHDGVVGSDRLGGSKPDPGLVGAGDDVVVGQGSDDAVVVRIGDQGAVVARVVEGDAVQNPLDVQVLADRDAGRAVKRDTIIHLLETDRVPILGVRVVLDERDGTETAVDLEAIFTVVTRLVKDAR